MVTPEERAIVLATVEAESGFRNVRGDGGWALGYGQVWPRWHWETIKKVSDATGVPLPFSENPWPSRSKHGRLWRECFHRSDWFSMAVAVEVIKRIWRFASYVRDLEKRWETFTKAYVGPAIPQADMERRREIWRKWLMREMPSVPEPPKEPPKPEPPKTDEKSLTAEVILPAALAALLAGAVIKVVFGDE